MKKLVLLISILPSLLFAQAYNVKTINYAISGFSNDSLKATPTFYTGDYEGLSAVIRSAAKDSSVFAVAYQRGYPDGDGSTFWKRPACLVDTFNTLTSGNFQTAGSWFNAVGDTDLVAAIDSTQLSGFVVMAKNIQPYRSPYGRFFIKGLTGNKKIAYNVLITVVLNRYTRVDVGTGKQPE